MIQTLKEMWTENFIIKLCGLTHYTKDIEGNAIFLCFFPIIYSKYLYKLEINSFKILYRSSVQPQHLNRKRWTSYVWRSTSLLKSHVEWKKAKNLSFYRRTFYFSVTDHLKHKRISRLAAQKSAKDCMMYEWMEKRQIKRHWNEKYDCSVCVCASKGADHLTADTRRSVC